MRAIKSILDESYLHTLPNWTARELKAVRTLAAVWEFDEFPEAIFDLADSLEILDYQIQIERDFTGWSVTFKKTAILFLFSNIVLQSYLRFLGEIQQLEMIGL